MTFGIGFMMLVFMIFFHLFFEFFDFASDVDGRFGGFSSEVSLFGA